jgi:hypothetical protein
MDCPPLAFKGALHWSMSIGPETIADKPGKHRVPRIDQPTATGDTAN